MQLPEKFTKYPWVTVILFVGLVLLSLYALADIFGSEWLADKIDNVLDD